jgi:hypothetical protein
VRWHAKQARDGAGLQSRATGQGAAVAYGCAASKGQQEEAHLHGAAHGCTQQGQEDLSFISPALFSSSLRFGVHSLPSLALRSGADPFIVWCLCLLFSCSVDHFSKDWYDIKVPSVSSVRNVRKTLVSKTQGTEVSDLFLDSSIVRDL